MPVPLLTTDFWQKPEPVGSVNSSVMKMMAMAGQAIQERVEKNAQLAEARMVAPTIGKLVSEGYQAIAAGDMGGFGAIAQAQTMGAGNPILAAMAKDAGSIGTSLAHSGIQSKLQSERISAEERMTTARIGGATDIAGEKQYHADLSKWQENAMAEQVMAEREGRQPNIGPKPNRADYLSSTRNSTAPSGAGGFGTLPDGLPSTTNDLPQGGGSVDATSGNLTAPMTGGNQVPQQAKKSGPPPIEVNLGNRKFEIQTDIDEPALTVKRGYVTSTYPKKDFGKTVNEFAKAVGQVNSNGELGQAAIENFPGTGNKGLEFEETSDKKWKVLANTKNGVVPVERKDKDGNPIGNLTVDEEHKKAYDKMIELLPFVQKIGVSSIKEETSPLDKTKGVEEMKTILPEITKFGKDAGLKPDEIAKFGSAVHDEVLKAKELYDAKKIDQTRYQQMIEDGFNKVKENTLREGGVSRIKKLYGVDQMQDEAKSETPVNKAKRAQQIAEIDKQISEIEDQLQRKVSKTSDKSQGLDADVMFGGFRSSERTESPLSKKAAGVLATLLYNLQQKRKELQ